jgi:hypothetical protein
MRGDAGDAGKSSRSGNKADVLPPPRPFGLRPAGLLAFLLAANQRAWGPAAKCNLYSLTGPKQEGCVLGLTASGLCGGSLL